MNSIMHIAYHAKAKKYKAGMKSQPANIRLLTTADNNEVSFMNGYPRNLQVVHSASLAEELLLSQRKVADAVKIYEDRIYKRVPNDIA